MDKEAIRERMKRGPKGGYGQLYEAMGKENPHKRSEVVTPLFTEPLSSVLPVPIDITDKEVVLAQPDIVKIQEVLEKLPDDMRIAIQSQHDLNGYAYESCLQAALAMVNLTASSHYNVDAGWGIGAGAIRPLILHLWAIAPASNHKTSIHTAFKNGITRCEPTMIENYITRIEQYRKDKKAYERDINLSDDNDKKQNLKEPDKIPYWNPIMKHPTKNAMLKRAETCRVIGLHNSEGATFVYSHDMRDPDRKIALAGHFCDTWDGAHMTHETAVEGGDVCYRYRRLTSFVQIQAEFAVKILNDDVFKALGYNSRQLILVVPTDNNSNNIVPKLPTPEELKWISEKMEPFHKRIEHLYKQVPSFSNFDVMELTPITMTWEASAELLRNQIYTQITIEKKKRNMEDENSGGQHCIGKGYDHVCRLAANLAAFEGRSVISLKNIEAAYLLFLFYVQERDKMGELENNFDDTDVVKAERAFMPWIKKEPKFISDIFRTEKDEVKPNRNAPSAFRKLGVEKMKKLLDVLVATGKITRDGQKYTSNEQ